MPRASIPAPISGGLVLSYKCQARCRHCIYACSPDWRADFITEDDLDRGLAILSRTIQPSRRGRDYVGLNEGLHFTGGEPFLNFDLLLRAVELGTQHGIPSMFVETNSIWARDDDTTHAKLTALREAGLRGIMISVNPFYAEYVPFEHTARAIRISQVVFGSENTMIYQWEYFRLFLELGITGTISIEEYAQMAGEIADLGRVELFFMGRGTTSLQGYYPRYPAGVFFAMPCMPDFIRAWHNHFDNYGNFMPGFCGGISLGNWYEMDRLVAEGVDLDDKPVLAFLVRGDMAGLCAYAEARGFQVDPRGYLSKCHLCTAIRKHLVDHGDEEYPELAPREFYAHLD